MRPTSRGMQRPIGITEITCFASLALMWGGAFLLIKLALPDFQPVDIVFWRLLVASLLLGLNCFWTGSRLPRNPKTWLMIASLGVIANGIPFSLVAWAETQVASGFAAMLVASVPLWTAALIPLFVPQEELTRRRLTGILIGFAGVALLTGGLSAADWSAHMLPKAALLTAALCYAICVIIIRRLPPVPAPVTAFGMNLTGWASVAPVAFLFGHPFAGPVHWQTGLAVGGLGLFSSAGASLLLVVLITRVGAARASLTNYLVPVVAATLGALVLSEKLGVENLAGLSLVLAGVWVSTRQPKAPIAA